MILNVDEERIKLIQLIDDETFDFLMFVDKNIIKPGDLRINFIWQALTLTLKYPQVELYLKNLLNHYTIDKLEKLLYGCSILHFMTQKPLTISLNAFEMIINYGVNINIEDDDGYTAAHILLYDKCDNHIHNILNLLIKHGANLNIMTRNRETVLDILIQDRYKLDEGTKNCVMTLIDYGATTNKPKDNVVCDFAECYKCSSIKLAIKK